MASFRKRGDRWQARVIRFGCPDQVKTFATKQDAECWARSVETEIDKGLLVDRRLADRTTLASILEKYAASVCPTKRGGVIEGTLASLSVIRRLKPDGNRTQEDTRP